MSKCPVQVEKTFQFNSKVQPIEIYPDIDIPDGSKVTVMGWGYINVSQHRLCHLVLHVAILVLRDKSSAKECLNFNVEVVSLAYTLSVG
ncbi:unnamed protein product [Timema podura]|uniref:Peptidase S1 domain-containing protein n=1 Tax=Timema podura TaxID=61482 RepID=A0ABN7PA78_TIMPD|nr:unnamed protein product [Timema podura]